MRFLAAVVLAGVLVVLGGVSTEAVAQPRSDWVQLGCQTVSFNVDRDVLRLARHNTRYRALRLHASRGDVEMLDLGVIYGSGQPDNIPVRSVLRRGGYSPPIDLKGSTRFISQIDMVYRSLPDYTGRDAVVCVEGLVSSAGSTAASWLSLGCQTVSFNVDRDVLHVRAQDRQFRAIRLQARGSDVEMLDLRLIYGNGEVDDMPVRRVLRRDVRTPRIDLRGAARNIARIEMFYRSLPGYTAREAVVCIEGAQ